MSGIDRLNSYGQSPWYDNLTRQMLRDGGLASLIRDDGIRGVTSNPTIFEKAMAAGEGYDEQLLEQHRAGASTEDAFWALVVDDIAAAAALLRPVHDATQGEDGYVSVEVSPRLAHDTDGTVAQAIDLHRRVNQPNVMIKIPATPAGLPAITEVIAAGINVNVTLIFDLDRYDAVLDAHEAGLARLAAAAAPHEEGGNRRDQANVPVELCAPSIHVLPARKGRSDAMRTSPDIDALVPVTACAASKTTEAEERSLLDLWAKKDKPRSVYADITWMGYIGETVPQEYEKIFQIVRGGRDAALEFVRKSVKAKKVAPGRPVLGFWMIFRLIAYVHREMVFRHVSRRRIWSRLWKRACRKFPTPNSI